MNILGISAYTRGSAACLLQYGAITAAAQEERFSRQPHDTRFPKAAIEYCLEEGGLTAAEIDCIAYHDRPLARRERRMMAALGAVAGQKPAFYDHGPQRVREKLVIPKIIRKHIGYEGRIHFVTPRESHAAAAFFLSPFEEAAFLTLGGIGEWSPSTYGSGKGNRIEILGVTHFPHSLALLQSACASFAGFTANAEEPEFMELASFGEPRFVDVLKRDLIRIDEDGAFRLNEDHFGGRIGRRPLFAKFAQLLDGPARAPGTEITQREMDMARSVQAVMEEALLMRARHVHKVCGQRHLCIGGGAGLDSAAHGRLLRDGPFDDIWVEPAGGGAGNALGSAMFVWHQGHDKPRPAAARHHVSRLGPAFSNDAIESYLVEHGIRFERLDESDLCTVAARLIARGHVVGWFQGNMELGPRALGARSILGDPRSQEVASKLNLNGNPREPFRPFVSSVMAEYASECFDLDRPSPHGLIPARIAQNRQHPGEAGARATRGDAIRVEVPAIAHAHQSTRIQTVTKQDFPRFYRLLQAFREETGCPVLINAPFHARGEPIVCTPHEAYTCFMRTRMDFLAIGSFLLDKKQQPGASIEDS